MTEEKITTVIRVKKGCRLNTNLVVDYKNKKKIIISVTNDLVSDYRVHKVADSLRKFGFDILLVGRKNRKTIPVNSEFKTRRFRLIFQKSALFYTEFNIRLFLFLLFVKADIFLANDLDTLPANFLASKIRGKKLVYDSHEYFTEVPELIQRKRVQKIWKIIEQFILPKVKYAYTVCDSIALIYNEKYGTNMKVVRNIPTAKLVTDDFLPEIFQTYKKENIILYQGAVNVGRGLEQVIRAMHFIANAKLLIIGNGDIKTELEKLVNELNLQEKIIFIGRVPFNQLFSFTKHAQIGISIEENIGLNYYYALPNKLFDYIRAGIPVLVSRLPEIEKIVKKYDIGSFIENHNPEHIAQKINDMLQAPQRYEYWKENLKKASEVLCWENEEKVLISVFKDAIQ